VDHVSIVIVDLWKAQKKHISKIGMLVEKITFMEVHFSQDFFVVCETMKIVIAIQEKKLMTAFQVLKSTHFRDN